MEPSLKDGQRVIVDKWAYRADTPQRGDVAMFYYPVQPAKKFVKRVIAEDGDAPRVVDGRVFVNDTPVEEDAYVSADSRSHDDWGPQVVPEGYFFVMAERRDNSLDSRHWGFVPRLYILGKVSPIGR